jgi:hypothetical protein
MRQSAGKVQKEEGSKIRNVDEFVANDLCESFPQQKNNVVTNYRTLCTVGVV